MAAGQMKPDGTLALRRAAKLAGLFAIAVGIAALLGWWLRLWTAVTIVPGWPPMVANAALMSILSGAALALLADPALRPGSKRAACAFSSACALAAALTLVEYALGIDLRIDQLLARAVATAAMRIPGRPMPHTALAFLLLGLALCLLDAGER